MDTMGFMNYLLSLGGESRECLRDIPMLLKLEEEHGISLDDYVPYNEEDNKRLKLKSILNKSSNGIYSYRTIWKYLDYKKKIADISLESLNYYEESSERRKETNGDYFCCEGKCEDVKYQLSRIMSEENACRFIDNIILIKEKGLIPDDKLVFRLIWDDIWEERNPYVSYLIYNHDTHYFNIRISGLTLILIATILDINLTLGLASSGLMILGVDGKPIVKLDAYKAEVCLIMETLPKWFHMIDETVLDAFDHECVHNDLNCRYRIDGKCTIEKSDIKNTLDDMCQNYIFKKIGDMYKYCF